MKSTFRRLFTVTVATILVAILVLGVSLRFLTRSYLGREREEQLEANAEAVSALTLSYYKAMNYGLGGHNDLRLPFQLNLTFAEQVAGTNALVCTPGGTVVLCSEQDLVCEHLGLTLDEKLLESLEEQGSITYTGTLQGIWEDRRYVTARECTLADGTVAAIVVISEPMKGIGEILSEITEMFIMIALIVMIFVFLSISLLTSSQCRPLRDMADAAKEFGHGNLKARVEVSEDTTREIADLALAFNNMASSLEKSEYQRQEFVANVSHELKTPMTTIGGYVDGILDGTIPPEKERQYLTLVSDEVKRLSRLVRSMLDVSRLQDQGGIPKEKMRRFDAGEALGQVLITFEKKINDKNLEVEADFPDYPIYVQAEPDSITQVIYNLIDNAVKFCPQEGLLQVRLSESDNKAYISVANTGETIPPEELPLVFDRFHKMDKSRSLNRDSWGLGLYIVKTIICGHGEDISVTSRDGRTEFTFTLTKVNSL